MPISIDISITPSPSFEVVPSGKRPIDITIGGSTTVINTGTTGSIEVPFAVPTMLWLVNHNIGYIPIVVATDLAGNQISMEMELSETQIKAKPNQPTTGYIYYR
jgi:hypothetical protein